MSSGDSENIPLQWTSLAPHAALKPIEWLIGNWKSISANGSYPTIEPFSYCEEIWFKSVGQPMLNYSSLSWHPVKKSPMHLESGFLRINPGTNNVAFMVAHNFGLSTLEEGEVLNKKITLGTTSIARMPFAKDPTVVKIERTYELLDNGDLEVNTSMQTSKTELCQHLKAIYKKIS